MKSFIITGVQMKNKGSQAMLFSTINGLKEKYPDCNITCFTLDYNDLFNEKYYNFELLPWDTRTKFLFETRLYKIKPIFLLHKFRNLKNYICKIEGAIINCDAIFDSSGYVLGSGWDIMIANSLLQTTKIAKRFDKEIFIMPQSIGPFDWKRKNNWFVKKIYKVLPYAKCIFAREKEGYDLLCEVGLENCHHSLDLVLRDKNFQKSNYIRSGILNDFKKFDNYVGIVINENIFRRSDNKIKIYNLYENCINELIKNNISVLLIKTSSKDTDIIKEFGEKYQENKYVNVVLDDYSSIELNDLISRMKFIISSRYHAIIFALRSSIPVISIGWSNKYTELMGIFGLGNFCFDFNDIDICRLNNSIHDMLIEYSNYSSAIQYIINDIHENSVFDEIDF